jgi:bis(5'-nucleosyl)-tetraphosphatase (symmetrical)
VNRGPDSLGVLRLARALGFEGVLGNHDVHLLQTAAGLRDERPGDTFGDVLASAERDELLVWLAALPFLRVWDDLFLVHAGLHPRWADPVAALAGADPLHPSPAAVFAVRVRHCAQDGTRPEQDDPPPPPPFRPWYELYDPARHGGRGVVFGHWAARGLVREARIVGLDSGCVWGGALSAWIAEEDRLVQVPAARAYAPRGG